MFSEQSESKWEFVQHVSWTEIFDSFSGKNSEGFDANFGNFLKIKVIRHSFAEWLWEFVCLALCRPRPPRRRRATPRRWRASRQQASRRQGLHRQAARVFQFFFQVLNISVFDAVSEVECVTTFQSQTNRRFCTFVYFCLSLLPHVSISTPRYLMVVNGMCCLSTACGIGRVSIHHDTLNVWRIHAHRQSILIY